MSYQVSVVDYPAEHLIGKKVRTSMQNAQNDCPVLWMTFGPRISEVADGNVTGVYGISFMVNETDFDYWAAVPAASDASIPEGMETVELPAGLYAKCSVESLEKLGDAFMYVYGPWIAGQTEYGVNFAAPCFELYPADWQLGDGFEIYVPVMKV